MPLCRWASPDGTAAAGRLVMLERASIRIDSCRPAHTAAAGPRH